MLGEDIANELVEWFNAVDLTYRTDLRELNALFGFWVTTFLGIAGLAIALR